MADASVVPSVVDGSMGTTEWIVEPLEEGVAVRGLSVEGFLPACNIKRWS
jgi:hypothetical protein